MNKTKTLIIGANGMLGGSLIRCLSKDPTLEVVGTIRGSAASKSLGNQGVYNLIEGIDVADFSSVKKVLKDFGPAYVLNCVGIIKQLKDSKSPVLSIEINSLLPHKLADACNDVGARLIHFSTDCVFSGSKGAYSEKDTPDATDLYGRSKLLGEVDYGPHLTLRTSIIGHELDKAVSLVDWFLQNEGPVNGYVNAVFSGMPTVYVSEFLRAHVFGSELRGLYHLSVEPINKHKLLCLIKDEYGLSTEISPYADFCIDRSLSSGKLRAATGFVYPTWENLIRKMREEYLEYFV